MRALALARHTSWLPRINRTFSILLVVCTIAVSLPLTVRTFIEGGGPWGFGIISLQVLLPLTSCILFSVVPWLGQVNQRAVLIWAHATVLGVGLVAAFLFPVLPRSIFLVPLGFVVISIVDVKHLQTWLGLALLLSITVNLMLLKWELDFHRNVPLIELINSSHEEIDF